MLFALRSRNSVRSRGRWRESSRLPNTCTFAGTSLGAVPRPGNGVVPMTVTAGSSKTSAGLSARAWPVLNAAASPSASGAAGRRVKSANRDAPRQFAYRDIRDLGIGLGVDHRDGVGSPAGDVELAAVGGDRHVPRPPAYGNPGDDRIGDGVDHLHCSLAARGHVDALAARVDGDAVGTAARLDAR